MNTNLGTERSEAPHHESISDREFLVLRELAGEHDARVGFQGLRRRLGLHPQALTRTLRGLERTGLVRRDADGYQLLDKGVALVADATQAPEEYLVVFRAILPTFLDVRQAANRLSGRWFRGLHWYAVSEVAGETTLLWSEESSRTKVRLRILQGTLLVEVEKDGTDPSQHLGALKPLLEAVAELYGEPGSRDEAAIPRPGG